MEMLLDECNGSLSARVFSWIIDEVPEIKACSSQLLVFWIRTLIVMR
jgi:hypothetical protein